MYQALYRKLRPKTFGDIIGQRHIVTTLRNQVASGRVSHAYLFCGSRGTGKTTTALVFAKAVNCDAPGECGEPCGECRACMVARGSGFNVIEIDAASNNGVENVRDIREEVKYPPAEGRYKVYIIDEAHMLSGSAFNALLKTLEEPPPGVIFILATTDPQKIPATVHSRCQRFDFKRIPLDEMTGAIEGYMRGEGLDADPSAIRYAARTADGSMRDALSILDQCAASHIGMRITPDMVREVTGAANPEDFERLYAALLEGDAAKCLDIIDMIVAGGKDMQQAAHGMLGHLRGVLVAAAAGENAARLLDISEERADVLRGQYSGQNMETLSRFITAFSELSGRMRYAGNPRLLFEAACVSLAGQSGRPKTLPGRTEVDPGVAKLSEMIGMDINIV